MAYPFWDVPVGYGVLMAVIAVVHVFISHFAIGGGLYLVVSEQRARKAGDAEQLRFLEKLSQFFVLVTLVAGALTGVGIWFIIGLLNPAATEALIHHYVWGWATEWTFFVVEITAAILYYYGWKRMPPAAHVTLGWIYFVFAWLSLFIINGIITFMLTPGAWLKTGAFWDGFFNPTFWPSLVLRTGVSLMLACLYALLVAARYESGAFKARLVRYTAIWGLLGLVVTVASQYGYWHAIPADITAKALQTMRTPIEAVRRSLWMAGGLGVLLGVFGLLLPARLPRMVAVLLMVLGLGWFSDFEMFRESIRKPYVISGYLYGNGVEVAKTEQYKKEGYLKQIAFRTGDDGADLFRHACRSCHTLTGYKPLKPAFDGTDRAFIASIIQAAHTLKGNMPPFLGTAEEAGKIAGHLHKQIDPRPLAAIYGLQGIELGRKSYEVRCGKCHVPGKESDKSKAFAGQSARDLSDMLDLMPSLSENMPAFTGDATERQALISYLELLGQQASK